MKKKILFSILIFILFIVLYKVTDTFAAENFSDYVVGTSNSNGNCLYLDESSAYKNKLYEYYGGTNGDATTNEKGDNNVTYNWLHAIEKMLSFSGDYADIANNVMKNNTTGISSASDVLYYAAQGVWTARTQIGSFIGQDGKDVTSANVKMDWKTWDWVPVLGTKWIDGNDNKQVLSNPVRSYMAFKQITKTSMPTNWTAEQYKSDPQFREKVLNVFKAYDKKLYDLFRKLSAASSYCIGKTKGKDNASLKKTGATINIFDGPEAKFKYNITQIKYYEVYYSRQRIRYTKTAGLISKEYKKILHRCWGAKAAAEAAGFKEVATSKKLFVSQTDDKATKLGYDRNAVWLYLQIFPATTSGFLGSDIKGTDLTEVVVDWANKLVEKDEFDTSNPESITKAYSVLRGVKNVVNDGLKALDETAEIDRDLTQNYEYDADAATDAIVADDEAKIDPDLGIDFQMPENQTADRTSNPSGLVEDAEAFVTIDGNDFEQSYLKTENLQGFSQTLYSMLLGIGIVLSVIIGLILGVKFMLASVAEKAEVKKLLITYAIGCAVIFGAFGIWKLVVTIMQNI